ncbi:MULTISPECIES: hypothetical protein [Spirosoma]|uniref:DUF2938 domain-containing protein n=1 Tax=Spirosoma liriopis TaxID=2937440 RepID=A0ABT0HJ52_9BACT|nr:MULTISPECIES: hypothetical protein [Spirosoma]MCK8492196.1 hypothetical protein [Spirosoma liriopis]UHG91613.1 hypothetical protein LQ777_01645 [Spirosoma oryzicola]
MNGIDIILAGVAGTAIMTAFMYGMTFVTKRVMKVVKILGTMLTFRTSPDGKLSDTPRAISIGIIAHYAIGVLFAFIYNSLWSRGVGRPDFESGIWLGIGSGVAAIAFWYSFFAIHPNPPAISLKHYLVTLFLAHIVFTYGVILAYNFLK